MRWLGPQHHRCRRPCPKPGCTSSGPAFRHVVAQCNQARRGITKASATFSVEVQVSLVRGPISTSSLLASDASAAPLLEASPTCRPPHGVKSPRRPRRGNRDLAWVCFLIPRGRRRPPRPTQRQGASRLCSGSRKHRLYRPRGRRCRTRNGQPRQRQSGPKCWAFPPWGKAEKPPSPAWGYRPGGTSAALPQYRTFPPGARQRGRVQRRVMAPRRARPRGLGDSLGHERGGASDNRGHEGVVASPSPGKSGLPHGRGPVERRAAGRCPRGPLRARNRGNYKAVGVTDS